MPAPAVCDGRLVFAVGDTAHALAQVGLDCDDAVRGSRRFRRTATGWRLAFPIPDLARLEYRLVVTDGSGETSVVCDPDNPLRVGTAFGDRSVVELPGYVSPPWLDAAAPSGSTTELAHQSPMGALPITVWEPDGLTATTPAPLLVVHDGPEYANLASLTTYAASVIARGDVQPFRMALMHPVHRDEWYAGNPDYVSAEIAGLTDVADRFPVDQAFVVMGASLGGLCALLVAETAPSRVAGVFAQSGSFFTPDLDPQEAQYPYFTRVTGAVEEVLNGPVTSAPLHIGMTCGGMEENHDNNVRAAKALLARGHDVRLTTVRDLHNYTAWRDALDPPLTDVLRSCWGQP